MTRSRLAPDAEPVETERSPALEAAIALFNSGRYLACHELFEELWEASEGGDSNFYKGLIQASIALHHLEEGNHPGAVKLHAGQRALLAAFLPVHRGVDLEALLESMRAHIAPPRHGALTVENEHAPAPQITFVGDLK